MANTKTKKTEEKKEIKETIDVEKLKGELKDFITLEIKNNFNTEVEKANKRLIREKNKKIFIKNIVIIVLLLVIGYLLYMLYDTGSFDKFFNHNNSNTNNNTNEVINKNDNDPKKEEVHEPTLEELTDKYGYLLEKYYINEKSEYLDDYFNGNLTTELKNYITLTNIDSEKINSEEEISAITDEAFKSEYESLFDDDYEAKSFTYNGNEIKYVTFMKSYISDKIIDSNSTKIDRMVTDIKVNGDTVIFETVEAIKTDDNEKIANLKYTFKEGKLVKFEK